MSEREIIPAGTRTKVQGKGFIAREANRGCSGCAFESDNGTARCRAALLRVYPKATHTCGTYGQQGIIWKPLIRRAGVV